jgi:hypothetical protein
VSITQEGGPRGRFAGEDLKIQDHGNSQKEGGATDNPPEAERQRVNPARGEFRAGKGTREPAAKESNIQDEKRGCNR